MVFKVVRSADSDRDLGLIFDHLIESYIALGDPLADAFDRAAARLHTIEGDMEALAQAPYQGTFRPTWLQACGRLPRTGLSLISTLTKNGKFFECLPSFSAGKTIYEDT